VWSGRREKAQKSNFFHLSFSRGNVVWKEIGHSRLHSPCMNCPFDVFCSSYAVCQLNVIIQQGKNYDRQQMLRNEPQNGPTLCKVSPTSLIRFFPKLFHRHELPCSLPPLRSIGCKIHTPDVTE